MAITRSIQPALVRALRERRSLTTAQLANRMEVNHSWVQRLEDHEIGSTAEIAHWRVQALADALRVEIEAVAPENEPEWKSMKWMDPNSPDVILQELEDSRTVITIGHALDSYLLPDSVKHFVDQTIIDQLQTTPKLIPSFRAWSRMMRDQQLEVRQRRDDYLHITLIPEVSLRSYGQAAAGSIQAILTNIEKHRSHTIPFLIDLRTWEMVSAHVSDILKIDLWDKVTIYDSVLLSLRPRRGLYSMTYHPMTIERIRRLLIDATNLDLTKPLTPFAIAKAVDQTVARIRRLTG